MQIEQHDGKLIITVDVSETAIAAAPPSSTGKTLVIAGTNGFRRCGRVSINLNVTVPNPHYEAKSAVTRAGQRS